MAGSSGHCQGTARLVGSVVREESMSHELGIDSREREEMSVKHHMRHTKWEYYGIF